MIESNIQVPVFNLWTQPWITVEQPDLGYASLGIEQVLLRSHQLTAIYETSPLVMVGIHRLLAAILQDALDPRELRDIRRIRQAGRFDEQAICKFGEQYAHRFDLFSEYEPFLQSADLPQSPVKGDPIKTVAYLAPELPSGTAVTHFQHGDDDSHVFCASCAARGLITIPAFATSGGAGIKPSINGVPPLYVHPAGKTLFETLALSLILPANQPDARSSEDQPWWRRSALVRRGEEVFEVGYLQSLTFPARRVRLHLVPGPVGCSRCGQEAQWGVRTMVFEMGECRPKESAFWFDPFAAYRINADKPPTPIRPSAGKVAWREFNGLFLRFTPSEKNNQPQTKRPAVVEQISSVLDYDESQASFRCIGMRTDMKAKIFEWVDAGFEIPVPLLRSDDAWVDIRHCIEFAEGCASDMASAFRLAAKREKRFETLRSAMLEAFWAGLADPFRSLMLDLASAYQAGQQERELRIQVKKAWAIKTVEVGLTVFSKMIDRVGDDAAALRQRVDGKAQCSRKLNIRKNKEVSRYE